MVEEAVTAIQSKLRYTAEKQSGQGSLLRTLMRKSYLLKYIKA
jgi:hypothetical protein